MAKAPNGLAILLSKMQPPPDDTGEQQDEQGEDEPKADHDKIRHLAEAAFPDNEFSEDQLSSLHELIRQCAGTEY